MLLSDGEAAAAAAAASAAAAAAAEAAAAGAAAASAAAAAAAGGAAAAAKRRGGPGRPRLHPLGLRSSSSSTYTVPLPAALQDVKQKIFRDPKLVEFALPFM